MDESEKVHATPRERGDSLLAEQQQLDADREAMAAEIVAGRRITSIEEGKRFAQSWIATAAQYAANADYYREERDKAVADLDTERGHTQTLLDALKNAVRQGGELRRRAIMADALDEHEDPFEPSRKLLDEALSGRYPPTIAEREVVVLRRVLETANNQLFDSQVDDVEHQIACHADTLPEVFRRLAAGHAAAFETLQEIVHEWVEPSPPTVRGAFSEDLYNEDGSEVTVEQARERNRQ